MQHRVEELRMDFERPAFRAPRHPPELRGPQQGCCGPRGVLLRLQRGAAPIAGTATAFRLPSLKNEIALNFSTLFGEGADRYAAARPLYPKALFDYIATQSPRRLAAWDCGTGNGQAAIGLAGYFERVEATDISAEQIARAFAHPRVRYGVQPAETTHFADAQFDVVNVGQALHWFELDAFWAEVRRVLKPGGLFVASGYRWSQVEPGIDAVIQRELLDLILPYWPQNNRLVWNGYRDVTFPFERVSAPALEMVNFWNLDQLFDYFLTWSGTRLAIAELGPEFVERARQAVAGPWGGAAVKRAVVTPLAVLAGRRN
jgi:SAM-dependent methyltransferase